MPKAKAVARRPALTKKKTAAKGAKEAAKRGVKKTAGGTKATKAIKKAAKKSGKSDKKALPEVVVQRKVSAGSRPKVKANPLEKLSQLGQKWEKLQRQSRTKAPEYSMAKIYSANSPIQHKKLGWGYILSNKNDRLEVLFEDGVKYLISNYRSK